MPRTNGRRAPRTSSPSRRSKSAAKLAVPETPLGTVRERARMNRGPTLGVALIGSRFMGRAHSNAWSQCARFFDLPRAVSMQLVAGRDRAHAKRFAARWGWAEGSGEWRDALNDSEVSLVDVATPNHLHAEMAIAALRSGRHVACEKPLAGTLDDARRMRDEARKAAKRGVRTFVWFNYRRCPAVALAHQLVREGRLGEIRHVRAHYLQDWGRGAPAGLWRFRRDEAGSGAHGDLNAHIVDMARFITGLEVVEVTGAIEHTFDRRHQVDDAVLFLARLRGGAVASFEATRFATGNQNRNEIEVNGERGALRFDFERMNELLWWNDTLPSKLRGWSRIMCTNAGDHPYASAYWPAAHLIGYEHGFVSMAADIVRVLGGGEPVVPLPDFEDGWMTQCVLEAAIRSARSGRSVKLSAIR
ncbi:MAG: Gfo/Idh/MocA family oxidoreductase [Phycisphaeraceae bacterium]|nr:Gfo/Idh/MocA family oxidoreductase [Phycisphaeraceae bacterium]